jgi:hypothetical protein
MERSSQTELKKRAKALYFGENSKIKKIFVDEFGRFSYTKENLVAINKGKDVKVIPLTPEDCAKVSAGDVKNLSKEMAKLRAEKAGKLPPKTEDNKNEGKGPDDKPPK